MHDLIDILIKLQVAVITLLVPMLIFYINQTSNAKKAKDDAYDLKIKELQNSAQLDSGDPEKFTNHVNDLHTQIAGITNQRKQDLNLLNPLRQMKRIYGALLTSFSLIIVDVAVREGVIFPYNHYFSCALITLSIFLFALTARLIAKVASIAIKSKEDVENILNK